MPIKESVTPQDVVNLLNELVKLDAVAVFDLVLARAKCNNKLTGHPTVQCSPYDVGMLGVLNGLFGVYDGGSKMGWGTIQMNYNNIESVSSDNLNFSLVQNVENN